MLPCRDSWSRVRITHDDVRWARRVVSRIVARHPRLRDDLESAALEGMCKAARGYVPGGVPFRQYAWQQVQGSALDFLREQNRDVRNARLRGEHRCAQVQGLDDDEWATIQGHATSAEDRIDDERARAVLHDRIRGLSSRSASMLRSRVFDERTLDDVAADHGIKKSFASRIIGRALADIGCAGFFRPERLAARNRR